MTTQAITSLVTQIIPFTAQLNLDLQTIIALGEFCHILIQSDEVTKTGNMNRFYNTYNYNVTNAIRAYFEKNPEEFPALTLEQFIENASLLKNADKYSAIPITTLFVFMSVYLYGEDSIRAIETLAKSSSRVESYEDDCSEYKKIAGKWIQAVLRALDERIARMMSTNEDAIYIAQESFAIMYSHFDLCHEIVHYDSCYSDNELFSDQRTKFNNMIYNIFIKNNKYELCCDAQYFINHIPLVPLK